MLCIYQTYETISKIVVGKGIRCVVYIDDGLIVASGIERASQDTVTLLSIFCLKGYCMAR